MLDLFPDFRRASFPRSADSDRLRTNLDRWHDACANLNNTQDSGVVERLTDDPDVLRLLSVLFSYSPYLTALCLTDPESVLRLLTQGPARYVEEQLHEIRTLHVTDDTTPGKMPITDKNGVSRALRVAKRRVALSVACGDITGLLSLDQVTGALSDFADASLQAATRSALAQMAAAGRLELRHPEDPELDSGFVVIAMGKLGGRELNYSSDIDIISLFDPDRVSGCDRENMQKVFVRVTRELVRLMDERTADGYVFRTDLRLRPDPGATPISVSFPTAEVYYESQGQNWERAAMIKARPAAGDIDAGTEFLDWLTPFVWRKNLDFAAIQDIHSIKRQINAHRGGDAVAVPGHNIKLGRGGIREIEFFAQTQQLIWGGRLSNLRVAPTLKALDQLVLSGQVEPKVRDELSAAYAFLRRVEHRLQMINDEQTQTLPSDPPGLKRIAEFLGYEAPEAFAEELLSHLRTVEGHYADLFEDSPDLGVDMGGNLVFTGSESDPDTLKTLGDLGFEQPETVDAAIRGWHHGRYRATRSVRARELLTEMMPRLLQCIGATPDPDTTFKKFDEFLEGLPAGIQLFSMIHTHPGLLDLLAEVMGEAPRLADILSRRPSLLDAVLSSDFLNRPDAMLGLTRDLETRVARETSFEGVLDTTRRWTNDRRFIVGLQSLKGIIDPPTAAWALSGVAETALAVIKPAVEREFAERHGSIRGETFCTVALGKLGGHEMTPTSDLDLVFIYPGESDQTESDGKRPLSRTHYFARLGQRYINAISVPTSEGILYEVDMRLRPSGNAGPIACSMSAFETYHEKEAWTWERMALTRARPINGPAPLKRRIAAAIRKILMMPTDSEVLRKDVADMRKRIDDAHHTEHLWSIKHLRGGLVDLEFIVQYLQLRYAAENPDILSTNTWRAIRNLEDAGYLSPSDAACLKQALDLWQSLQSQLHLSLTMDPDSGPKVRMPEALRVHLAKLGGVESFDDVEKIIRATSGDVFETFRRIVGEPASGED
ncbi:MAG: bifunctional [glutamine synthetase] adenylyltransferase/[glutamine synthetase]-adenylyl-L-tyrosine phosphorylase [Rhodospirillales bacterium]